MMKIFDSLGILIFMSIVGWMFYSSILPRFKWYCLLRTKLYEIYPYDGAVVTYKGKTSKVILAARKYVKEVLVETLLHVERGKMVRKREWTHPRNVTWLPWWDEVTEEDVPRLDSSETVTVVSTGKEI